MCTGRIKHDVAMHATLYACHRHPNKYPNTSAKLSLHRMRQKRCVCGAGVCARVTRKPPVACVSIVWNFRACARFEQRDMPFLTCHTENFASTHQTAHTHTRTHHISCQCSIRTFNLHLNTSTSAQHQHKAEAEYPRAQPNLMSERRTIYIKTSNLLCAI